ncbi:hypothetical protein EYC80_006035 [Monilinia laxa]|uniref:Uncharacterized protein n=1 Tax=Monilinia laxa TaxID=61186 RepID=A0A5N6KGH0_MONLA|nr:hypothetical protein EYC80_006035 [Monilinia laxa]
MSSSCSSQVWVQCVEVLVDEEEEEEDCEEERERAELGADQVEMKITCVYLEFIDVARGCYFRRLIVEKGQTMVSGYNGKGE